MTNERVRIPFDIPDGASVWFSHGGYTNADNNWWWAIDNVIVAAELPSALVERSFSSPVFSGAVDQRFTGCQPDGCQRYHHCGNAS